MDYPRMIGYARVSTISQKDSLKYQVDKLKEFGCFKIFEDIISGVIFERDGWNNLKRYLRPNDIVVVIRYDRLGRNTKQCLQMFDDLIEKGGYLQTIASQILDPENPNDILTFTIQLAISAHEYKLIKKRTYENFKKRLKEGYGGRPHKYNRADVLLAKQMRNEGKTVTDILKEFNISRRTYYNMVKKDGNNFKPRTKLHKTKRKR